MHVRMSLRTKLTIAFAAVAVVPLLVMSVAALYLVGLTHRQDVATMELQLARQKAEEIDKTITAAISVFDLHVSSHDRNPLVGADQKFLLDAFLREHESIVEVSFVDLSGAQTLRVSRNGAVSLPARVGGLAEFQEARQGKLSTGPVHYTLDGPAFLGGAPVTNADGNIIMVLLVELSLKNLNGIMANARLGHNGMAYVVDQGGTIVAAQDSSFVGRSLARDSWVQELLGGTVHDGRAPGDRRIGAIGIMSVAAGLSLERYGWGVVAEWPVVDADSVLAAIRAQTGMIMGLAIVAVLVLSWFVGRRIVHPIAVLGAGAARIGKGDFSSTISLDTGDELESLGQLLNQMATNLRKLEQLKEQEIRTSALAESLKKEKELSWAKDEFIRSTSHQLRTPLSIIGWNIDLANQSDDPKEIPELLKNLKAGFDQLNGIVNDLLTASEFGLGFRNIVAKPVDFADIVEKIMAAKDETIKAKGLTVQRVITPMPNFTANAAGMQALLEALLDNAITYTPAKGTITITVAPENGGAHISIRDTGIGIPAKDQPLIFTQFFRATNAINMKNVGTGLGLYIAKNVVDGHGGKVWLESVEGQGSTFHAFVLPTQPPTPAPGEVATVPPAG